jgi:conjugative relaxase-like TrwC/TraI family protein
MIRMIQSTSPEAAKKYFSVSLSQAEYYINDQEMPGHMRGKLADRLGVAGLASKDVFFALCDNLDPNTGKPLTPRMNERRITGYDINFHCPKSVSIVHALSKDDHILKTFDHSVQETMLEIEAASKTRVRKGGVYDDRDTGELVWADFIHQTARPVENHAPDPHLHAHCFVFNATFDAHENKIKAAKFRDIKRDMPFYQAKFQKRLADNLVKLGYQIRKTKTGFEIEGVPQEVINHFSKRTNEIGRVAKEKGITNAKELDALGALTRGKKQRGWSMQQLKDEWRRQVKEANKANSNIDKPIRHAPQKEKNSITHANCINYSLEHNFERASVMSEKQLLKTAYEFAFGQTELSLEAIANEFKLDNRIIHVDDGGRKLCTTKEVLKEERRMIELAKQGQNKRMPLDEFPRIFDRTLKEQHKAAIKYVMTSKNFVSIVRGVAGAGKTTMLHELDRLVRTIGKNITYLAPSADASRNTLRKEGFKDAETVAKFLIDEKMQEKTKRNVILVDEAGLLGIKDTVKLLEVATKQKARIVFVGDTRQHSSVVRGDALRILNTVGKIQTAEMNEILRQKDFQYKDAVEFLSKGNVKDAFTKLDTLGVIKTIDPVSSSNALVEDYLKAIKDKKKALVICPTHKQGNALTDEIRRRMRDMKMLGKKEIQLPRYTNLNMSVAEKGDWRNFEQGHIIQFNQNMHRIKRGSLWVVDKIKDERVHLVDKQGRQTILPRHKSENYDVSSLSMIALSQGDKIRITKPGFDNSDIKGKSKKKKKLDNGMMLDVVSVSKLGDIKVRNKASKTTYLLRRDYGNLTYGHCITSHAAQGKTVDEVFIYQPADTFAATDAKQFYVSVSRGRDAAHIYTDDRDALLEAASELGDRQCASELVAKKKNPLEPIMQKIINDTQLQKSIDKAAITKQDKQSIELDYEPKL